MLPLLDSPSLYSGPPSRETSREDPVRTRAPVTLEEERLGHCFPSPAAIGAWFPGASTSPGSWGRTVLTLIVLPSTSRGSNVHPAAAPYHILDKGKTGQTSNPSKRVREPGSHPTSPVLDRKVRSGEECVTLGREEANRQDSCQAQAPAEKASRGGPEGGTAIGADRDSSLPTEMVQAENKSLHSRRKDQGHRLLSGTATPLLTRTTGYPPFGLGRNPGLTQALGFPSLPLSLSSLHLAERQLQKGHAPKSRDRSEKEPEGQAWAHCPESPCQTLPLPRQYSLPS